MLAGIIGMVASIDLGAVVSDETRPNWSAPTNTALKKSGSIGAAQQEPNFLNNLDCELLSYRVVASSAMQTGCFTPTAFGLLDSDSDMVIFNGTDEAIPIHPYTNNGILAPWPRALDLISLDSVSTGGSYISLYKNPLSKLQDERNILLQLVGKKLTSPADLPLLDPSGNRLIINSQTLAFSDNGSWLVAETYSGSFVRVNLATLDVKPFAKAYGSQGSPAVLKSRVAITDDGKFVLIANDAAAEFKIYDLDSCSGSSENLKPLACTAHDYRPFLGQQISGLQSIRHVRFVNDGLASLEVLSSKSENSGVYLLAPFGSIDHLIDYLGMGDSYTSGEGAFDYTEGTDSPTNSCHLSHNSYPILLTLDVFSATGGHSVACSGAVINDIVNNSDGYVGQMRSGSSYKQLQQGQPLLFQSIMTNYLPGYFAQYRFASKYQPRVITVEVGGNDIGFGDLVQSCVQPHLSRHQSDSTCYNTYEDRLELKNLIDRTIPKWQSLYKQLKSQAPGSQIYAIGYPRTINDQGSCGVNVLLNKSELEFAMLAIDEINAGIKKAAETAGANYVDITESLYGHRLCEARSYNIAVNGLTAGRDAGFLGLKLFGKESYHPNALGHQLIEQAILSQTHNFTLPASTGTDTSTSSLLNAPKTGRSINRLAPDPNLTSRVVKKGSSITIKTKAVKNGQKPRTTYKVSLGSPNNPAIAQVISDDAGDIDSVIVMPSDTPSGGQTIHISGPDLTDEVVDIWQPIYVPDSDTDADGDSLPDSIDTCPGAADTGQDEDHDGVDDICDPAIGEVGAGGSNTSVDTAITSATERLSEGLSSASTHLTDSTVRNHSDPKPAVGHLQGQGQVLGSKSRSRLLTNPRQLIYEIGWLSWMLAIGGFVVGIWAIDDVRRRWIQKH